MNFSLEGGGGLQFSVGNFVFEPYFVKGMYSGDDFF